MRPSITITLNDKEIGRKELDQGLIAIGRDMDNDIVINNLSVSRCHAIIQIRDGKIFVKDMASANGTFVNGQKIDECELRDGDLMLVGKHILKLDTGQPKESKSESREQHTKYSSSALDNSTRVFDVETRDKFLSKLEDEKNPDIPKLTMEDGKKSFIKSDYFIIGKRYDADIVINGLFVNEHHAIIQKQTDGTYKIINMGSFIKPVKVNGKVVKEKVLTQNDLIQIGNYRFNYNQ